MAETIETAGAPVQVESTTTVEAPATTEQTSTPATTEQTSSDGAEQMATILSAAKANPDLAKDPEIKAILELAGKAPKAKGGKTETEAKAEEGKTEVKPEAKAEEGKTETETKAEETKAEEAKEVKSDSVFFKDEVEKGEKIEFKDLDALNAHIKEKFSIEDPNKFLESVNTWRSQAQNAEKTQTELDNITDAFTKMPKPLYDAFTNWSKGEPWEKAVQGVGILDFDKGFNEYDAHTIVNHYFPGDYTKEDFTGEEKDSKIINRAISLAKSRYETDKQAIEGQRATHLEDAEAQQELVRSSSASSVESLKKSFPSMGKTELKKVESIMTGGDLTSLFFDKQGGYVIEAAKKIAMMLFAEKDIADANKRTKSSQDVLRDKVDAGNEKPPTTTSTQSKKSAVPEAVATLHSELTENLTY